MNAKSDSHVIDPPKTLQAKVPVTGGPSMAKMVEDADVGLQEVKANYEDLVQTELRKINDAISRAIGTPTSAAGALTEILGISHEIKGQAASLDYPLLTAIAQSLCRFISTSEPVALKRFDVIEAHASAMGTVVAHTIRGDVRGDGKKVLEALDAVVEKVFAREKRA